MGMIFMFFVSAASTIFAFLLPSFVRWIWRCADAIRSRSQHSATIGIGKLRCLTSKKLSTAAACSFLDRACICTILRPRSASQQSFTNFLICDPDIFCFDKFFTFLMQVVTDEATLLSLGINTSDSKEQKLREGLVTQNLRGKKEKIIIKNIRHISHEIAGICSNVCLYCGTHMVFKDGSHLYSHCISYLLSVAFVSCAPAHILCCRFPISPCQRWLQQLKPTLGQQQQTPAKCRFSRETSR